MEEKKEQVLGIPLEFGYVTLLFWLLRISILMAGRPFVSWPWPLTLCVSQPFAAWCQRCPRGSDFRPVENRKSSATQCM